MIKFKRVLSYLTLLCFILVLGCTHEDVLIAPDSTEVPKAIAEVDDNSNAVDTDNDIFTVVEKMPEFSGGSKAYSRYMGENLKYPKEARSKGIQGKVLVTFIVNKDGSVSDHQLLRGIGAGCDEEALRVLMEMPNWKPGEQRGRQVRTMMKAAVTFKLPEGADGLAVLSHKLIP